MQLDPGFGPPEGLPDRAAVAVSGGSDSMALLHLAHRVFGAAGKTIIALTVDHHLRPESADEARQVAAWCADLGVEHDTLNWEYDGAGNLSAAAREGRYREMAAFCAARGIAYLYTGHTKDDQAETVLMRLARGSGVDGLAGIARETRMWGVTLVRPLLRHSRESLRGVLTDCGQDWVEDATNDDPSYDRVKAREILKALEPLGLTRERLGKTAQMMGLAREVLDHDASLLTRCCVRFQPLGYATLDPNGLLLWRDTALRVLADVLQRVGGGVYRPRLDALEDLLDWVMSFPSEGGRTLHGCLLRPFRGTLTIMREPARCAADTQIEAMGGVWDARFSVKIELDPDFDDLSVGALGETGLQQIPKDYDGYSTAWRSAPREARITTPGLWDGETLLAALLAPWVRDASVPVFIVKSLWPD